MNQASLQRVNCQQAHENWREASILDIRDHNSFGSGHLPGSKHIDANSLQAFVENADRNQPVLVVCYHGNSSLALGQQLIAAGFENVAALDGGFEQWKTEHPNAIETSSNGQEQNLVCCARLQTVVSQKNARPAWS